MSQDEILRFKQELGEVDFESLTKERQIEVTFNKAVEVTMNLPIGNDLFEKIYDEMQKSELDSVQKLFIDLFRPSVEQIKDARERVKFLRDSLAELERA